ncbi:putative membrane protein [Brucella rhizosphaerae]|uniref:Putative membrane protein n=1 Tax=Brucella rhizosphaerae TaxID=571254 RepID=A0A256FHD4_9HYPH|nr:putative membrane protein [Brucella rhizosphaerae]
MKDAFCKERMLGSYLLASGDILVVLAGILSVAYLSWKKAK